MASTETSPAQPVTSAAPQVGAHLAAFAPGWGALLATQETAIAIAEAGSLGYASVALPVIYPHRYPVNEVRGALARAQIGALCLVALPPVAHLPARPEHARNWLGRALDVTEALGSNLLAGALGWTPASARNTPDSVENSEAERALLVEVLRDLAQDAQRRGIRLALEPANRYETTLCNTLREGAALVEAIAMPNMGLLANTHHMHMEEADTAQALQDAGKHLLGVRLAENHRGRLGQGAVAWEKVWRALVDLHFAGALIVDAPITRVAENARMEVEPAADRAAKEALQFVRAGLAAAAQPAATKPVRKQSAPKKRAQKTPSAPQTTAEAPPKNPTPRKRTNTKSYRGRM